MKPGKKSQKRLNLRVWRYDQTIAYLKNKPGYSFISSAWKRPGSQKKHK